MTNQGASQSNSTLKELSKFGLGDVSVLDMRTLHEVQASPTMELQKGNIVHVSIQEVGSSNHQNSYVDTGCHTLPKSVVVSTTPVEKGLTPEDGVNWHGFRTADPSITTPEETLQASTRLLDPAAAAFLIQALKSGETNGVKEERLLSLVASSSLRNSRYAIANLKAMRINYTPPKRKKIARLILSLKERET